EMRTEDGLLAPMRGSEQHRKHADHASGARPGMACAHVHAFRYSHDPNLCAHDHEFKASHTHACTSWEGSTCMDTLAHNYLGEKDVILTAYLYLHSLYL